MKKLLIASSAIVGVSMLATTAHAANVTAGGSYTFKVDMGGANNASDAMTFNAGNYSFFVNAEKTTDSGLTLTGATHLDGSDSGNNVVWDEATGAIAGDFGTVSFSNEGGSVTGMASGASGISVSNNDVNDVIGGSGTAGVGPSSKALDRTTGAPNNTVSYTSPNISGFKAGVTIGRNGGNSEVDVSKEAGANPYDISTDANANREYTGIAFSYSIAGATIGFAQGSETTSVTVKGYIDDGDDSNGKEEDSNGSYEESWSGTKLSLRYSTGPLTVGFSTTTIGEKEGSIPGPDGKFKATEDKGLLADNETNETEIGFSYNYGAGTASYVQATEDRGVYDKDQKGSAEDLTTSIIAVKHNIGDGLVAFFEQHSGNADIEASDDGSTSYESVSEIILGITLSF